MSCLIDGDDLAQLASTGLVGFQFFPDYGMTGGAFSTTELGKLFLEVIDAA